MVDGLCGQQPPSREQYTSTWTLEEWAELHKSLITLFHLAAHNSSDEKVRESQSSKTKMIISYLTIFNLKIIFFNINIPCFTEDVCGYKLRLDVA